MTTGTTELIDELVDNFRSLNEIQQRFTGAQIVVIEVELGPTPTVHEILMYVREEARKIILVEVIDSE